MPQCRWKVVRLLRKGTHRHRCPGCCELVLRTLEGKCRLLQLSLHCLQQTLRNHTKMMWHQLQDFGVMKEAQSFMAKGLTQLCGAAVDAAYAGRTRGAIIRATGDNPEGAESGQHRDNNSGQQSSHSWGN